MDAGVGATQMDVLQFAGIVALGVVSYFLKRTFQQLEVLQDEVQSLKTEIAVTKSKISGLLERDRMERLEDYRRERRFRLDGGNSEES